MNRIFLPLLFLFCGWISLHAQQIGDEALKRAQQGKVSFLEGQFIAYLSDTVSKATALEQFHDLGFEVLYEDINPIRIELVSNVPDSTLSRMKNDPVMAELLFIPSEVDTLAIRNMLKYQGMPKKELKQAMQRVIETERDTLIQITFDFQVDEASAKRIMTKYRNAAYRIIQNIPRSVTLSAEPGNEPETMKKAEALPFVTSTAMIAVLEE